MISRQFDTPILLLIYNRPTETQKVFATLRKIKPKILYIAADGPRIDVVEDRQKCQRARKVIKQINWPCQLKTLFQKKNLGCGLGPVTGINWFFENEPEGIILEDDCLAGISFFYFCQELLNYYRNNRKIMHISGNNFQYGKKRGNSSYYFSEFTHSWGWATWRRAWKFNDFEIVAPEIRKHIWDKQWLLSVKRHRGLAIIPNVNLVSNIGLGDQATHTKKNQTYLKIPLKEMTFPLIHPRVISQNFLADLYTYQENFGGKTINFIYDYLASHIHGY